MSDDIGDLKQRIKQLEKSMQTQGMFIPPSADPFLAEDEWYAIFSDWQNLTTGTITKLPYTGGSNQNSVFIVKRKI